MTKYAMVVDLRRCVGCQTCTAACKLANATPPGVMWRRVVDVETGSFPNVQRVFVPTSCQHCDNPPCVAACPSEATKKRADGIVTQDYEMCIGCGYCITACPYEARFKVEDVDFAYGDEPMRHEAEKYNDDMNGVVQKCTFCVDTIDEGIAKGLTPGVDPDATPACVNSCIANALTFGDLDDPDSNVSKKLRDNQHFRMHEDEGTGSNMYYLWDKGEIRL